MTFLLEVCCLLSETVLAPCTMGCRVYGLWKAPNGYGKGNGHGASPFGIQDRLRRTKQNKNLCV